MTPESVVNAYYEHKKHGHKSRRAGSTWASNLGHPCTAYTALTRIAGEKADEPDAKLCCIFEEGSMQEQQVKIDLQKMGFKITQADRSVMWEKYQISGKIDGYISADGDTPVQIEIKSCSPFIFQKFNSFDDIKNAKKYFYRKWAAQLMVYMLLESEQVGWFILKNKATGEIKILEAQLDLEFAENLIKKAEIIKDGVNRANDPGRPDIYWRGWLQTNRLNDPEICLECPLKATCLPEIDAGAGVYFSDDGEMAEALKERETCENASHRFEELDKEIKSKAKRVFDSGSPEIICGDFVISGAKIEPKGKSPYWRVDIERIGSVKESA